MPHETVFMTFQVRALDPSRFLRAAVGQLSDQRMEEIERGLAWTLALRGAGSS